MLELLTQDKADSLDELDALQQVRKVQKLDVTEILVADHVTFPQKVQLVTCSDDVDDEV